MSGPYGCLDKAWLMPELRRHLKEQEDNVEFFNDAMWDFYEMAKHAKDIADTNDGRGIHKPGIYNQDTMIKSMEIYTRNYIAAAREMAQTRSDIVKLAGM